VWTEVCTRVHVVAHAAYQLEKLVIIGVVLAHATAKTQAAIARGSQDGRSSLRSRVNPGYFPLTSLRVRPSLSCRWRWNSTLRA